jgi:hypothetical protein
MPLMPQQTIEMAAILRMFMFASRACFAHCYRIALSPSSVAPVPT